MLLSRFPVLAPLSTLPEGAVLGEEYHNKTAGVIGMGNVGEELLNILNGLGIKTVYYNRSSKNVNAKQVDLTDIFKQDIIFVTIATNPSTKDLLSDLPNQLQEKNYLIDVSAADDLYDKKKVVELLDGGKIKGYALELFDAKNFKLISKSNFIATPHIAWYTIDAERRMIDNYLNRAKKILKGEFAGLDFII